MEPTHSQKLRALKAKAWRLGPHGISAATLAEGFFRYLAHRLRQHSNGTNPMIHLGAVEHPAHDPQFHAILATVSMLRSHGPAAEVFDYIMDAHHIGLACKPPPGPSGVVLHRLHNLGWRWLTESPIAFSWIRMTCPSTSFKAQSKSSPVALRKIGNSIFASGPRHVRPETP